MSDNKMYNILGIFKGLNDNAKAEQINESVSQQPVYENVEPRGDIMEAVRSLEEKYMGFKAVEKAAKAGGAENPAAVAASIGRKKYGKKKFQKAAAKGKKLGEGHDDLTDLDDYQFAEPDTDTEIKPAKSKAEKAAIRQRIQDLADKAREKDDWFDGEEKTTNVRTHHAKYQDEPEVDEATSSTGGEITKKGAVTTHKAHKYGGAPEYSNREDSLRKDIWDLKRPGREIDLGDEPDEVDEVAPPGAKAERMVKHIKQGYAKDGKLSKREKGIAYATAWKAHNKGQVEEGVKFGDKIANSKAELKKAKPAMVKESIDLRNHPIYTTQEAWDHYAKELAEQEGHGEQYVVCIIDFSRSGEPIVRRSAPVERAKADEILAGAKAKDKFTNPLFKTIYPASAGKLTADQIMQTYPDMSVAVEPQAATHELDEIARLAGLPEGNAFTGKLAATSKGDNFSIGDKEYTDTSSLGETALEEEEMETEGNEFSGALAKAKAAGEKEFDVDGKRYTVKEDVTLMADGDDVVNLIRKLSGLDTQEVAAPVAPVAPVAPEAGLRNVDAFPSDEETDEIISAMNGEPEEVDEERDIEYVNTPREQTAGLGAAIPSGNGDDRAKRMYSKEYPGDNHMAVRENVEEALWKKYSGMLKSLIQK